MTGFEDPATEQLLDHAGRGDTEAVEQLLAHHRPRLKRMVVARMNRALAGRLDPSDVVQEALAEAATRLPEYLRHRRVPFYPWLRELAWLRLMDLTRRHVDARRRSVRRESPWPADLSDQSAVLLADQLMASDTSPSVRIQKDELRSQVWAALARMTPTDREILVLRYVEQLSTREIAAVVGIAERSVRSGHRRAMERIGELLDDPRTEE